MTTAKDNMFSRCMYFNSNALSRKLNAHWNKAFARFDLPPSHGYLLRLVLSNPGLSQQSISDELILEKSTITRFLVNLENKGLLERREDEDNIRKKCVYPSEKALALQAELELLGDELYGAMCEKFGEEDTVEFVKSLRKFAAQL